MPQINSLFVGNLANSSLLAALPASIEMIFAYFSLAPELC